MADLRVEKLAKLLVHYSVAVKPGNTVMLRGMTAALPLVAETYREILRAGGHPLLVWEDDTIEEIFFTEASDEQLRFVPRPLSLMYETFDCLISVRGASNTRSLSAVAPARQAERQKAMRGIMHTYMSRAAAGELRWVSTMYPTPAYAQEADMSLREYEAFVFRACHVDKEDPVAEWLKLRQMQQTLVDWLRGKEEIVVKGPNADLRLSIKGRTFINSDGTHNMPSGEIFTGPVEQSVNGWVRFTYPAIYAGREVTGVTLRFEEGKVVEASAIKNESFLLSVLDTDPGARYLGEFAIGTNNGIDRFTKSILFDEKIGGTIHMAVGKGYPETGSRNDSAVHWDMICDMRDGGQIYVDGELFYDSGKFLMMP